MTTDKLPETVDNDPADAVTETPFRYQHTMSFAELLEHLGATLLVTTYQAGKLAAFRAAGGKMSLLLRTFDRAMGVAVSSRELAIATRYQIWFLPNEPSLAGRMPPQGTHDACFMPRRSHVTSNIDTHEIAWGRGIEGLGLRVEGESNRSPMLFDPQPSTINTPPTLWLINTQHCCLCTLDDRFSFVPRWKPGFVTELRRADPCHLNGLAMLDGRPKYVTCFAETNTPEGWREHKRDGGCLIDVETDGIVARGFSMPHSPRFHDGTVWLLDSGRGGLMRIDPRTGQADEVTRLPGYPRGLAFAGRYAFVGLSQARESKTFGEVAIVEQVANRKCGVWCIDTQTRSTFGFLEFEQTVAEVFDVQLLPGIRNPAIIGFGKSTIERASVAPPLSDVSCKPS